MKTMKSFLMSLKIGITGALAFADTHFVDINNPTPAPPYGTWETAATNIQDAVAEAVDGDTVMVADGHYLLTTEILVTNAITVQSANGPKTTIVDGAGTNRCFHLGTNACAISGFTVTNGFPSTDIVPSGGGILCADITEGMLVRPGLAEVSNCVVVDNSAVSGGGIYGGTINSCIISGNTATSSIFIAFGGGMFGGSARNCIITNNSAAYGGGLAYTVAESCVIAGNTATEEGGGIRNGYANNCTIAGNDSTANGGGTYQTTSTNSIIWYNSAGVEGDNNFESILDYCCSPDALNEQSGNITNAPLFLDRTIGNYRLLVGSPCINAGDTAAVLYGADLDGHPRIVDETVDIGAHEYGFHGCFITNFIPSEAASIIQWTAFPMWDSRIHWSTNLTAGFQRLGTGIEYPRNSCTDTAHAAENQCFYQVEVQLK